MFPGRRMSVDDRVKATGFLGGAGNRMQAMGGMPSGAMRPGSGMPPPPPPGVPEPTTPNGAAPNLREGEPGRECMVCQHYEMAQRHCKLYNFEPKPFELCDSFSPASPKSPEDEPVSPRPQSMPPPNPAAQLR